MKKLLILVVGLILSLGFLQGAEKEPAKEEENTTHDVLYLGEGRPALIRLKILVDGKSVTSRWEAFMKKYFQFLDRNDSEGLDRIELSRAPSPQTMVQFFMGNSFVVNQRTTTTELKFETLDSNRDGKVSVEEFCSFYKLNGAGPVIVSQAYAGANYQDPLTDRLFEMLDQDKDGKLSQAELQATEQSLSMYDTNDDELLSSAELTAQIGATGYQRVIPAPTRGGSLGRQPTTLLLIPNEEGGRRMAGRLRVARELLTRFDRDKNNKLSQEECGFPKALFDRLDRNNDQLLDTLELVRLCSGNPEREFTIRLGTRGGMMGPAMKGPDGNKDSKMSLTLDNVRLTVSPQSLSPAILNRSNNFLMNQFKAVDTENKKYVTKKQLNARTHYYLVALFDLADRNSDARLSEDELKAWEDLVQSGAGKSANLVHTSTGQGLFQALDTNADGQLSIREMRSAWNSLVEFDKDGDKCISKTEFPRQFRLTVSQGTGYVDGRVFGGGMGGVYRPTGSNRGPLWFRKMDRNADGDLSRAEWLGTAEAFDRMDKDKDGLISAVEAEQFDALHRDKTK